MCWRRCMRKAEKEQESAGELMAESEEKGHGHMGVWKKLMVLISLIGSALFFWNWWKNRPKAA